MLAYGDELELIKDNVKVIWENIGEGWSGDYDEDDPEDENLLRFTVYVNDDGQWTEVDDSSYCTHVSANTDNDELMRLLNVLMNEFYNVLHYDIYASVKKLGERMSWIS
jgi:hypothetical protein